MIFFEKLKSKAKQLKREVLALWFAARDARTPWYAKGFALIVTAYAFSPIDLIPDFVPVLGYLDDRVLIPAGIALCIKLIQPEIMQACREKADLKVKKTGQHCRRRGHRPDLAGNSLFYRPGTLSADIAKAIILS